jgi:hypothetical protein
MHASGYLPLLLPHLFKGVSDVERADLFVVLELEEFISTVSGHVHEDIRAVVREQSFRARYRWIDSSYMESWGKRECFGPRHTCEQPNEVLHGHFVATIVYFDVIAVEVQMTTRFGVYAPGEFVARVTRDVIGEHENDIRVGDPETLYGAIPG